MDSIFSFFSRIFDTSDFPARWTCGRWGVIEGWTHIISDVLIFASYVAIPAALFILLRKRRDIAFPRILWLFIAFILSCGIGHGVESLMFWWPAYRFTAVIKAVTAVVSVATAIALVRTLPMAISIPSLVREHREMSASLEATHHENAALVQARRDLEQRSSELVVRERRLRDAVAAAKACAISWNVDTGAIVWETGVLPLLRAQEIDEFAGLLTWEMLIGNAAAAELRLQSIRAHESRQLSRITFPLRGYETEWQIRLAVTPEPSAAGQPRTLVGLLGLVPIRSEPPQV